MARTSFFEEGRQEFLNWASGENAPVQKHRKRADKLLKLCFLYDQTNKELCQTAYAKLLPSVLKELSDEESSKLNQEIEETLLRKAKLAEDKKAVIERHPDYVTVVLNYNAFSFAARASQETARRREFARRAGDMSHCVVAQMDKSGLLKEEPRYAKLFVEVVDILARYSNPGHERIILYNGYSLHGNEPLVELRIILQTPTLDMWEYFGRGSGINPGLIEWVPPTPRQLQSFIDLHEDQHAIEPMASYNARWYMAHDFLREVDADQAAWRLTTLLGYNPSAAETHFHMRALSAVLRPNDEVHKTSLFLDSMRKLNGEELAKEIMNANSELFSRVRGQTRKNKENDIIQQTGLLRTTRDLLFQGGFDDDALVKRMAELVVQAALFHCPSTILSDLTVKSAVDEPVKPEEMKTELKNLICLPFEAQIPVSKPEAVMPDPVDDAPEMEAVLSKTDASLGQRFLNLIAFRR